MAGLGRRLPDISKVFDIDPKQSVILRQHYRCEPTNPIINLGKMPLLFLFGNHARPDANREGRYCGSALPRSPRPRTGMSFVQAVFGLLAHGLVTCALAAPGMTSEQCSSVPATAFPPNMRFQNFPFNVRVVTTPVFPLMVSRNNRYLVDQNSVPFLIVGDAPQTLIANLSQTEADAYMTNRQRYGINMLWINILCNYSDGCNQDATTFDGIAPFTTQGDLATPNPAYFERRTT